MTPETVELRNAQRLLNVADAYVPSGQDANAQRLALVWAALELECQRQGLPISRMIDAMKGTE